MQNGKTYDNILPAFAYQQRSTGNLLGGCNLAWMASCWVESDCCIPWFLKSIWFPFRGIDFRRVYHRCGKRRGPNGIDYKKFRPFQRTQSHTERQAAQHLKDSVMDVASVVIVSRKITFDIFRELDVVKTSPDNTNHSAPGIILPQNFHSWLHISPLLYSVSREGLWQLQSTNLCPHTCIIERMFDAVQITCLVSMNTVQNNKTVTISQNATFLENRDLFIYFKYRFFNLLSKMWQ